MTTATSRVWLITGSSSGLGLALSHAVVACGDRLVATARDISTLQPLVDEAPDRVLALPLDVTDRRRAVDVVEETVRHFGGVDVLANYAGYGLLGALEDLDETELREQFETNLFGALTLTRAVLPVMRRQRRGVLVQMSSLVGVVPGAGGSAYVGSKAALDAMAESVAAEVAHLGIRVLIVEPGGFRTEASGRSVRWAHISEDYHPLLAPAQAALARGHGRQPGDPAKAAAAVIAAVDDPNAALRLPLGEDAFGHIGDYLQRRLDEHRELLERRPRTEFQMS